MLTQLRNIGLSENEARVYLAMLELGPATALEIASKAGINRPTAYVQIETLKKRGLVSTQTKGKKNLFIPESPEQLESMLEREEKDMELKKDELLKILPDLSVMYNLAGEKPNMRFFEGTEGLMKMQDEFLKSKEKVLLGITSLDDVFKVFPKHLSTFTLRRVQRGIRAKAIYASKQGAIIPEHDEKMLRDAKYIDATRFPFNADITIYDDKIAIASLKGTISGALITNRELANSFKALFQLIWSVTDKL